MSPPNVRPNHGWRLRIDSHSLLDGQIEIPVDKMTDPAKARALAEKSIHLFEKNQSASPWKLISRCKGVSCRHPSGIRPEAELSKPMNEVVRQMWLG